MRNLVERSPNDLALKLSLKFPKLLREAIDDLFLTFNNSPTKSEAEAFRDCPFFDDPNEFYHFYWAMPFRLTDVLKYAIAMSDGFNVHRNAWAEASLEVSSPLVKMLVPVAIAQRKILKKCKKLIRSIRRLLPNG